MLSALSCSQCYCFFKSKENIYMHACIPACLPACLPTYLHTYWEKKRSCRLEPSHVLWRKSFSCPPYKSRLSWMDKRPGYYTVRKPIKQKVWKHCLSLMAQRTIKHFIARITRQHSTQSVGNMPPPSPRHLLPHVLQIMPRNPKYDQFQPKGHHNEENPQSKTKMPGNPKFYPFH